MAVLHRHRDGSPTQDTAACFPFAGHEIRIFNVHRRIPGTHPASVSFYGVRPCGLDIPRLASSQYLLQMWNPCFENKICLIYIVVNFSFVKHS